MASTNQQQLGIEQVMGALQNIRQASQQTAAGTREVEAASANLTELAGALMALAERYRHLIGSPDPVTDIRQLLLAAFEVEHREHIDAIRAALGADGTGAAPDWNDIFRRAHSLKGASRAVDLPPVEAVAHRLESLFEQVSAGAAPDREAINATHLALDRIEAFVAGIKADPDLMMPADAIAALDRMPGRPCPSLGGGRSASAGRIQGRDRRTGARRPVAARRRRRCAPDEPPPREPAVGRDGRAPAAGSGRGGRSPDAGEP